MATPEELERKFWKALDDDRTMMLGLSGVDDSHARPMTAIVEDDRAPLWFFTSTETALARQLTQPSRAFATFASKGHGLFATAHGMLQRDTDRTMIERLWNPWVSAWFEQGKDDPKIVLLRFDAAHAEVWLNENSLLAGVKVMLGIDPKRDYQDKVADVDLR